MAILKCFFLSAFVFLCNDQPMVMGKMAKILVAGCSTKYRRKVLSFITAPTPFSQAEK